MFENAKRWLVYLWIRCAEECGFYKQPKEFSKLLDSMRPVDRLFNEKPDEITEEFFEDGFFKCIDNKWGEFKVKKGEFYEQYILKKENIYGWTFYPPKRDKGVVGFPEILLGKSPFGGDSTTEKLPVQINKLSTLESSFDVKMYCQPKKYNLVFDLWFTHTKDIKQNNISHELMIWEDRNIAMPFGTYKKTVKLSSGTYKIYSGYKDKTSENIGVDGWNFTAFVRQERRRKGEMNLKEVINEMLDLGLINQTDYLCSVEFGNEIYNSVGVSIVYEFIVHLITKQI
jgi:hypothetical protein